MIKIESVKKILKDSIEIWADYDGMQVYIRFNRTNQVYDCTFVEGSASWYKLREAASPHAELIRRCK